MLELCRNVKDRVVRECEKFRVRYQPLISCRWVRYYSSVTNYIDPLPLSYSESLCWSFIVKHIQCYVFGHASQFWNYSLISKLGTLVTLAGWQWLLNIKYHSCLQFWQPSCCLHNTIYYSLSTGWCNKSAELAMIDSQVNNLNKHIHWFSTFVSSCRVTQMYDAGACVYFIWHFVTLESVIQCKHFMM